MSRTGKIRKFEDLIAWKKSKTLSLKIYSCTKNDGFRSDFALRDQVRRAVISVMSNIAEGFERYSPKEFQQYLSIARSSVAEVRSQIHLAKELKYLSERDAEEIINLCIEISKILGGLRRSMNRDK